MRLVLSLLLVAILIIGTVYAKQFPTYSHEEKFIKPLLNHPALSKFSTTARGSSGTGCAACVILIRVIENYAAYHGGDIQKAMDKLCDLLSDGPLKSACHVFVMLYGKAIIDLIQKKQNPDVVCSEIHLCTNKQCRLWKKSTSDAIESSALEIHQRMVETSKRFDTLMMNKSGQWWKDLFKRLYDTFDSHLPAFDFDNDGFATTFTLRGSAWRGRDCDDNNNQTYPGRRVDNYHNPMVDHNCNGISGISPQSGKPWETELCNVTQRGVIILGDSACARFRIPPQWVEPQYMHEQIYKPALQILENEMDFPHLGWVTGHLNDTTGLVNGPVDSFYLRQLERNKCIHRDYQSICVNGARSGAMTKIAQTTSRNQQLDHPAVVFYALVGNDVCTGHHTTEAFTKPEVFYNNVVATLEHLDSILPAESFVVFIGLADGGLLYPYLHNLTHPIGVTYEQVYDFLNCLEISPCWGWMQTNATIRDETSKAALLLSQQYTKIIQEKTFKNFKMIYHDFPMDEIVEEYLKKGGKFIDLIEPMDGFHPSQLANSMSAQVFYDWVSKNHPEVLGPINPNNAKIFTMFGNQGGY